ncbi:aldo/keto reductase [Herbiconiux solani]|uniref:aldo/keto reductase n=1 Tax=Herbiconiux solani TaxID=661329 RepID=UPI0008269985|nr:aldo/keto reductase [Herbiconiux solani]
MSHSNSEPSAAAAETFLIGGDLPVHRLGYGSMQLTGPGAMGEPADLEQARNVLRLAVELGVTLIDTADSYGPGVPERLIGETLHPYRKDLVIATKGGFIRGHRGEWITDGRPQHLRDALEGSLRRLRLDSIDLYQLHRIDHKVPLADQIGAMEEFRRRGLIRHIGLSEVTLQELQVAQTQTQIATVQNLYNLTERRSEDLVSYTAENNIGFIPWFPLATGQLTTPSGPLAKIASRTGAAPSQIALAWLLQHSPTILPIPGTSSPAHLRENIAAAHLKLTTEDMAALDAA